MTRTEFMFAWGYVEGTSATRDLDALLEAERGREREACAKEIYEVHERERIKLDSERPPGPVRLKTWEQCQADMRAEQLGRLVGWQSAMGIIRARGDGR